MTAFSAATIDTAILEQLEQRHIPGASLAIVRGGELVHARGYGFANLEWALPAAPDSVFEIASVTKTFTATAVMLLVNEGKLDLAQPITDHLPGLADPYRALTLRHLLSHTGGVLRDGLDGYWKSPPAIARDYDREEMLNLISQSPLVFAPGDDYAYSNSAYFLLGLIIERAGGRPFSEFLTERIFAPLGMQQTQVATRREVVLRRAAGYCWEESRFRNAPYCGLNHHYSNGGMLSTVLDLARWDQGLADGVLFSRAEWEAIWTPVTLNSGQAAVSAHEALGLGPANQIGLGWGLGSYRGHRTVGHGGALPGYTSQFTRYRDDDLTIIVLCNNWLGEDGRGHAPTLARVVADHCLPNPAPFSQAELAAAAYWSGEYVAAAERWVELSGAGESRAQAAYLAARAFSRAGYIDAAFLWLRLALDAALKDPGRIADESDLAPLRADSRWTEISMAISATP